MCEGGQHQCLVACMHTGSERSELAGTEGLSFEEGRLINKSLSALGNVVNALTDGRSSHIPYRDSKLTRALQVMAANALPFLQPLCMCIQMHHTQIHVHAMYWCTPRILPRPCIRQHS